MIRVIFIELVVLKDQYSDFELERAGAVGSFVTQKLFEIESKESLIDMMIE